MLGAYYLSNLHWITFYALFVAGIVLFIYLLKSIWGRKKRNIIIFSFLLIVLSWYLVGLRWRIAFFGNISFFSVSLSANASDYYVNENELAPDIFSLFSEEYFFKTLMDPSWPIGIPQLGVKWTEDDEKYYLQIYWYGFDRDDDKLLKKNRFPGWFRLLYFPWFYDGDLLITVDWYNKNRYKKRKEMERELFIVKSALVLHDEIRMSELEFVEELKKKPGAEKDINRIYDAVMGVLKETYVKGSSEEEIKSYLEEIKVMNHPKIYLPH